MPPSKQVESSWINWDECAENAFLEVATEYEWSGYLNTLASITKEDTRMETTSNQEDPLNMKAPLECPFQEAHLRAESWLPSNKMENKE